MVSWADVASKGLDFLQKPNALGFAVLVAVLLFVGYTVPLGVVTWTSWDNTNRLERAITALGQNCMHSVAVARKQ